MFLTHLMSGAEDHRFLHSVKSHPRYLLRLAAIIAVACGIFFNVLAIAIAQEFLLSGLAFIPVSGLDLPHTFTFGLPQALTDE